jgi:hypothetical protein
VPFAVTFGALSCPDLYLSATAFFGLRDISVVVSVDGCQSSIAKTVKPSRCI